MCTKDSGATGAFRSDRAANYILIAIRDAGFLPAIAISSTAATLSAAATTAAATPAISAAPTATAATRPAGAGASFVNLDPPSLEVGVVEGRNRGGRVGRLGHLDEAETARLAGEFVGDNDRALDLPRLRKQIGQVFLGNRVGQIAYIQLGGHKSLLLNLPGSSYTDDPAEFDRDP
jgi:hypothetical protein